MDNQSPKSTTSAYNEPYTITRGGNQPNLREDIGPVETVLGNVRTNPYTVTEMTAAWNRIYGTSVSALPTTHLYVRFSPTNEEEFILIDNAVPTQLYDYPLEYEVLEMGDYYPQPGLGAEDWPNFYAVVKPDFQSPISGYLVLEHLVLLPDDTYIVADAFRATGNSYTIHREQSDGTFVEYTTPGSCQPGSVGYPFCLVGDTVTTSPIPMPCEPGSPIYPDCYWHVNPSYPDGPPPSQFNACDCTVPFNVRNPAGCIQVRTVPENQWEGVRRVKVIMKNTWLTEDVTYTNHQGCFYMDKHFSGEVWTTIRFESSECKIRGWSSNAGFWYHPFGSVRDYVGKRMGPVFNNYLIQYDMWNQNGTNAQKFWGAATVNNALHEFRDMASTMGIAHPPHLDIWVGNNTRNGYALMKNYITPIPFGSQGYFLTPFISIIGSGLSLLPDVMVGINFTRTEWVKRLAYHEFAHASHFQNVGVAYWYELIAATSLAWGWGDRNSFDAGRIAICESWAEHIMFLMESMRFDDPDLLTIGLERTRNFNEDHIPIGIHYDLQDIQNDPFQACDRLDTEGSVRCGPINDNISGLSTAQLFSILTSDVSHPIHYRNALKTNFGLNASDVDVLFESYLNTQ